MTNTPTPPRAQATLQMPLEAQLLGQAGLRAREAHLQRCQQLAAQTRQLLRLGLSPGDYAAAVAQLKALQCAQRVLAAMAAANVSTVASAQGPAQSSPPLRTPKGEQPWQLQPVA